MKRYQIFKELCLAAMLLTFVGCGKKISSKPTATTGITQVQEEKLLVTQKEVFNVVRQEKMTYRYDCKKQLQSSKLETINSLARKLQIKPEHPENLWEMSAYNKRDGAYFKVKTNRTGNFTIDYAPNPFFIRVKEGINEIVYEPTYCDLMITNYFSRTCDGEIVKGKKAIVEVMVNYASEILSGERHIYKSEEECKRNALEVLKVEANTDGE